MNSLELLSEFNDFLRKKKAHGKKVIAYLAHDNIPEELLDAAGFFPLRLIFAGDDQLMNSSHDYLPPSTCSFAQSCIGLFSLKPNMYDFLDQIDYFLLSNHCVSDICVSETITNNFDIERLEFYLSYTRNENALKYIREELSHLRAKLETIVGKKIPDEDIKNSIIKYNSFKKILSKVQKLKIKGSEKLYIYQKAMLFGPQIQPEIEEFIMKKKDTLEYTNNKANIILTGCSIFLGDYLINLIEESGGNIILFDTWVGYNYYSQTFEDETLKKIENPMKLFVKRFENNLYGDHTVPESLENKVTYLENFINNFKKKNGEKLAIINHILKFCDHFSLFQSYFKEKLQKKNIKILNLERDYSRSIRGQLLTRIEAFMEMIE